MLQLKNWAILIIGGIALLPSCKQEQKKTPPTLLEGKKVDVSSILKKRNNDVVDALYEELVNTSEELQELDKQMKALQESSKDSLEAFKLYHEKNSSYYRAADGKINSITDSALRKQIRSIINKSRNAYLDSVTNWISLDSAVNNRAVKIKNLYTLLKLIKTLPLIEDFQRNNGHTQPPANGIVKDYDSLVNRLDSLTIIKADKPVKQP